MNKKSDGLKKRLNCIFVVQCALILIICVFHALSAGHYTDFSPINGTFQNYNPIRRLLAGQVPYRDFQDYLGLGHLYIGTIFTTIFGGNYKSSLIAFSFLTFISFALCSLVIGYSILKKKEISAAITIVVMILYLVLSIFIPNSSNLIKIINIPLSVGNSARLIRGVIAPVLCIIFLWGYNCILNKLVKFYCINKHKYLFIYTGCGILGGFAFVWSNDFGISCWACLIVMTFWITFSRNKKILPALLYTAYEIICSVLGLIIFVEILTFGHLSEYFEAAFGTSGYQIWYYNSEKSYYLYDLFQCGIIFTSLVFFQAVCVIIYMLKLYKHRGTAYALKRYGVLAYLNMVCLCAMCEYRLFSGGAIIEFSLCIVTLMVLFEICHFFYKCHFFKEHVIKQNIIVVISAVIALSWLIPAAKNEFAFNNIINKDGVYVEALGGNCTEEHGRGEDLIKTNEFLKGESFFATYASAQEVVSDTFQPSGTDYIIHVLGDKQREKYLNSFQKGNFKYVATIKETINWEHWCKRANWFFYRELYENYHPVYSNTYELYWEKNTLGNKNVVTEGFTVKQVNISETSKKIIVEAEAPINGTADVYIDAQANKKDNIQSKLALRTLLYVESVETAYDNANSKYMSNYLRPKTSEYIPIPIVNGYGEATITSKPEKNSVLQLNKVSCERIFTVNDDYVKIKDIEFDNNVSLIKTDNNKKNKNILSKAKAIELYGKTYLIDEISNDDTMIYLRINTHIDCNANKSNFIRVIHNYD